jgi:cytochrome b561
MNPPSGSGPVGQRWNAVIVWLHWLLAILLFALIGLGWTMIHAGLPASTTFDLFQWHKSLGILALVLVLVRIAARAVGRAPAHVAMGAWERAAATGTHLALYAIMLVGGMSGWLAASTAIIQIPTRFFDLFAVPAIWRADQDMFEWMSFIHALAAWGLLALVALHVAGALKHHFLDGDDVLTRMLP